ncbi:MAG: mannitol dehydrogenase family protein [Woeseiaceae bacterium]
MTAVPRLSILTRSALPGTVTRPAVDRANCGIGIVHLGVGAFMRAHVAMYCDDAMARDGGNWGIAGVSLRQRTVYDQLNPQDCLYTVAVRDDANTQFALVEAIRSIHVAPEDPGNVLRLLSDPNVRIVTLTITEKGYCLDPDSGDLDLDHKDIAHDLAHLDAPRSAIGFIVAALRARFTEGAPPVSLLSCDNLPANGARLRAGVLRFAREIDADLAERIEKEITFPATMVDRIVPATTADDLDAARAVLGCRDEALVKTEPFRQWVIEDRFASGRPGWDAGGAMFVPDVAPYETAKLRLLNGAHSSLAYLGYLAGYEYVHDVMQSKHFVNFLRYLMTREISPVTPAPPGMAHAQYIEALLQRFSNAALEHRTWQIAMDGSQKLPQRLLNTARQQLRTGGPVAGIGLAIAAWMRYALGRDESGSAIDVRDPLAARFSEIAAQHPHESDSIVERFFGIEEIFGNDLSRDARFSAIVSGALRKLLEKGSAATVQEFANTGIS